MADRVEDEDVPVGGRVGAVVDRDFAVDEVFEASLGGGSAVHFFDQAAGRVEDLDSVVCGVGDVDVAGGGRVFGDGDAVAFFEAAEADRLEPASRVRLGLCTRDVGAVGDVEVAGGRSTARPVGLGRSRSPSPVPAEFAEWRI